MTLRKPLDPFSEVVQQGSRRWMPDWYTWLLELWRTVTGLEGTIGGLPSLGASTTFYVRTQPTAVTIPVASPAEVNWTGHGLAAGDAVVLSLPLSRQTFTVTIASPGVFSATGHGLAIDDPISFETQGALPTGLTAGTTYYVIAGGFTANAFEVSTSVGGSAVNTSGAQSGTHKFYRKSSLPTGIVDADGFADGGIFYVISAGLTADVFRIATAPGGSALNATVAGAGLIYAQTGDDDNDGLAQTRTGAKLTVQGGLDEIATYDLGDFTATLQLANSTYQVSGNVEAPAFFSHGVKGGDVVLDGNSANRDAVVWIIQNNDSTFANCNTFGMTDCVNAHLVIKNFRFYITDPFMQTSIMNADFMHLTFTNMNWGMTGSAAGAIFTESSSFLGQLHITGTHDISSYGAGNACTVMQSSAVGSGGYCFGCTFNGYNNPTVDTWLIIFDYASGDWGSNTFNGNWTVTNRAICMKHGVLLGNGFNSGDPAPYLVGNSVWLPSETAGSTPIYIGLSGAPNDALYSYSVPTAGFTLNVAAGIGNVLLNPAGTLATGTVNLPAAVMDGQMFTLRTSQEITALTVGGQSGQTISNAPTTLLAGKKFDAIYKLSLTTWFVSS